MLADPGVIARALEVENPASLRCWLTRLFLLPATRRGDAGPHEAALPGWEVARAGDHAERLGRWILALIVPARGDEAVPDAALHEQRRRRRQRRLDADRRWAERLERLSADPILGHAFILLPVLLAATTAFWLCVTTPLSVSGQMLFGAVLVLAAVRIRRLPGTLPTLLLMAISLAASCRYGWWRITQSMDLDPGWETVLGYGLLAAECYAWVIMVLGFAQCAWPLGRRSLPLPADRARWPAVDVFIPTFNEPLSVLQPAVLAARGIDWPADRLRIHVLDDGRRESVREFAHRAGVGYLSRPDNLHAKAGNLNHALARTDGEFVAVFDCDHLPVRSFLQATMGWLLRDARCAVVQTPHHFFSPDPFERNLETFRRIPGEGSLFYGLVQDGNDFWNATFFCGSCAVLRRAALVEIDGFATDTVTEDAHTALRLHRRGWTSAYINRTLAAGLATESLAAHVGQRIRWARGMAQIFRLDNPLFGRGLHWMQRLCYANSMLHFFYGLPRLAFLTAPLAYLFFELHIIRAPAAIFALYLLPHLVMPHMTNARMQGPHRHSFWAEVYETVLAWYIALPTTVAFLAPGRGRFNVTIKGGMNDEERFDWRISRPYLALVACNAAGFAIGVVRLALWNRYEAGTVLLNLAWTTFNLMLLGAALGVAHERRQVRIAHRVAVRIPAVLVLPDGHTQYCHTEDYSLHGLSVMLASSREFAQGERLQVLLDAGDREHVFPAQVVAQKGDRVGVRFVDLSIEQQTQLIRCTFGRADAWSDWQQQYQPDLPLRGLGEIIGLGVSGYLSLFDSLRAALGRRQSLAAVPTAVSAAVPASAVAAAPAAAPR
jgi:cellulose synthase (UDP-forming)